MHHKDQQSGEAQNNVGSQRGAREGVEGWLRPCESQPKPGIMAENRGCEVGGDVGLERLSKR